ncbi:ricin-type beta-trefoil lectin domain protein [Stenotrophomonas sp.]|uniref:ricin-type beta-trefoil lectin domain protein n=1 Tax=Stenotrophomonas sp. TaxID=69392 RepID=UPI000D5416D0|nr:ricin-type beta-trefoil lectin domain protein [Stenotrophomonas sp.]AWH32305.1 hypothetical protein C1930_05210 [Stenotrophomonas sp. SAU14A_NAIMI4_8]
MNYVSIGLIALGLVAVSAEAEAKGRRLYNFPSTTTVSASNTVPTAGQTITLTAKVQAQALGLYFIPGNDALGGHVDFKVNGQAVGRAQISTANTPVVGQVVDVDPACWAATRDQLFCTYRYVYGQQANVSISYQVPAGFTTASVTASFTGDGNFSTASTSAPVEIRNIPTFGEIRGMNNRCLDAEAAGVAPGTAIQMWDCGVGVVQQLWTIKPGKSTITGVQSGRVWDMVGYGTGEGTRLQLYDAHGDWNQSWKFTRTSIYGISNKVLDATGASSANGTKIQLYDNAGTDNQLWEFDPANGQITGVGGKCLDVEGANTADGTLVQLWDCSGVPQQKFELGANGSIRGLGGKCLEAANGGTHNGNAIRMWTCNGGQHQTWRLSGEIRNPQTNMCLDDPEFGNVPGSKVHMWTCHGGQNQRWEYSSY